MLEDNSSDWQKESFFQKKWNQFVDVVGDDNEEYWVYGITICLISWYWILGGVFLASDFLPKSELGKRMKIQKGTNDPLDFKAFQRTLTQILSNQAITAALHIVLYTELWKSPEFRTMRVLPTFSSFAYNVASSLVMLEALFYYIHRSLHSKYIFKAIHKMHHEWSAPVALTAVYCHPVEHVVGNLLPIMLPIYILKPHLVSVFIYFLGVISASLYMHSGYGIPYVYLSKVHDYHHMKRNQCFGVFGIMDWLHGTGGEVWKQKDLQRFENPCSHVSKTK